MLATNWNLYGNARAVESASADHAEAASANLIRRFKIGQRYACIAVPFDGQRRGVFNNGLPTLFELQS
jgi:hypothetical protein